MKTGNTFSVLKEEGTESLIEKEEPPPIDKIDKDKLKRKRNAKERNSEMRPKPELPKNNPNKKIKIRKSSPLRCKSVK